MSTKYGSAASVAAAAAPSRPRRAATLTLALGVVGVSSVLLFPTRAPALASSLASAAPPPDAPPPDAPRTARVVIPMSEFLRFPAVVAYLEWAGIADPVNASTTRAGEGRLLAYLPARLVVDLDAAAVAGAAGRAAALGYVAFSLHNGNASSWNVVLDLRGRLRQFAPARRDPFLFTA